LATVAPGFDAYSSQSSFLRPVKATAKVSYHVDRAADGRTFATRLVRATQSDSGPCLYVAIISFQRRASAPEQDTTPRYGDRPPDLGGFRPHDAPRYDLQQIGFQINNDELPANMHAENPFDWRLLPFKPNDDLSQIRAHGLVRFSMQNGIAHLPSMALLSDQSLLELVIFANWNSTSQEIQRLAMNTTLNSQVSFHVPAVESTGWMVCESRTSWGAAGRIATHQQFWDLETGLLLMSCTQDARLFQPQHPAL
jgi:acyl-CoA thioesterase II